MTNIEELFSINNPLAKNDTTVAIDPKVNDEINTLSNAYQDFDDVPTSEELDRQASLVILNTIMQPSEDLITKYMNIFKNKILPVKI